MRRILLQASTHPDPMPDWALDVAAAFVERLNARIALGICQVRIPPLSNWLANSLLNVDGIIAGENRKSEDAAENLAGRFQSVVASEFQGKVYKVSCPGMVTPWELAIHARTYDLTIVPFYGAVESEAVASGLVFEAGKPVLLFPEVAQSGFRCDRIAIAWDGSVVAARALTAALPLACKATSVTLIQIIGEKDLSRSAPIEDAVDYLKSFGVDSHSVVIGSKNRDAADDLQTYCLENAFDLLVMGAFGHTRVREFILGGATRSVLEDPKLPVLMTH